MVASIYFATAASLVGATIRVFLTNGIDGNIRQSTIDVETGAVNGGFPLDVVFEAKVHSPIAAMETTDVSPIYTSVRCQLTMK